MTIYSFIRMKLFHTEPSSEKEGKNWHGFMFRYVDDVLSMDNSTFYDYIDRIYPIELEIKDTTETERFTSYFDLHIEIDNKVGLRPKLCDKRDDFDFVNFPFTSSKIPAAPA